MSLEDSIVRDTIDAVRKSYNSSDRSLIYSIIQANTEAIRRESLPVSDSDYRDGLVEYVMDKMRVYRRLCSGLSAVQLGYPIQIIMVRSGYNHIFMVNPEIKKLSRRESEYEEGCLSVSKGTRFMRISRPETVKVEYTSESGLRTTLRFNGLVSHTVQHEIDHLSGKLITDYVPSKGKKSV